MTRIGFLYPMPDPLSPTNWSGTPRSLAVALCSVGFEVVPVAYRPPSVLRRAVTVLSYAHGRGAIARGSPFKAAVRTRVLARELASAQQLDALVALGTDLYDLGRVAPSSLPVVTYDDATFAQVMRHPDSDVRRNGYPAREVGQWSARQADAARRATACCVSTAWAATSMIQDYGVSSDRVHVVGMGHRPRRRNDRSRDWSDPRFLFVGVDWGRKNGDMVLRAFARLHEEYPRARLDLVGDHPAVTRTAVFGHGFLARNDPGAQQHLDDLYARATAFVLPSRFDPSPIAYLEAASAGLPVIATTEGGASELLGNAAISVHPDDEDGLVAAMRRLSQPVTARRLGEAARRRAASSTWEAVASRIVDSLGGSLPSAPQSSAVKRVRARRQARSDPATSLTQRP
jgi:glycosyltransferase involved in cell wall biosynthesis